MSLGWYWWTEFSEQVSSNSMRHRFSLALPVESWFNRMMGISAICEAGEYIPAALESSSYEKEFGTTLLASWCFQRNHRRREKCSDSMYRLMSTPNQTGSVPAISVEDIGSIANFPETLLVSLCSVSVDWITGIIIISKKTMLKYDVLPPEPSFYSSATFFVFVFLLAFVHFSLFW